MEQTILFSKLVLAHLVGDFLLQPEKWVIHKEAKKWRSPYLYGHVILHVVLTALAFWNRQAWPLILLLGVSHYLIDLLKITFNKHHPRLWFFLDQLLHLIVLALAWYVYTKPDTIQLLTISPAMWVVITGYVFVTIPASVCIKVFFAKWDLAKSAQQLEGLEHAGQWIGMMERILILTFVLVNQWEAVGFLLAAKSIFRFGDLKNSNEINLTEYILIGTLLSFSIAIFTGLILHHINL